MRTFAACALAALAAAALGGWVAVAAVEYRTGARALMLAVQPYVAALCAKEEKE